ncbi:MAG: cupredoxin domain-containing protein, partial [Acidimicrobiia bacterium]
MNGVRRALAALGVPALLAATFVAAPTASAGEVVSAVDEVVTVHVRDNVFSPASLNVAAGTTIRWVNDGDNVHNVTPNAGHSFGSGALAPGKSYVHKFADPGS